MSAQKRWRQLRGFRHLADVIADVRIVDGVNEKATSRGRWIQDGHTSALRATHSICLTLRRED